MLDSNQLEKYSESESIKIRKEKESIKLLNERFNTPNTSLLLFHFDPNSFISSDLRLKDCSIYHNSLEGKDIYTFDNFFLDAESKDLRNYSRNATFSRSSYASDESREKGEIPARSMNNKEKWEFFATPPPPVKEIYKLLEYMAFKIDADISTLPWDLCDSRICASAVATNRLERESKESMEMGKHVDFNTENGIPFGIPILYSKDNSFYPSKFLNGENGYPWLISFMLYVTEDNFHVPEYGLGTIFCNKNGETALVVSCQNMRFVLFEGDIIHSIEESKIPNDIKTWRISYVFKLIINPRQANQSMKNAFFELIKSYKGDLNSL